MYQAASIAQTSGILAAAALQMQVCSKLKGLGETILDVQSTQKEIAIGATGTPCGFQSLFTQKGVNYTVEVDR